MKFLILASCGLLLGASSLQAATATFRVNFYRLANATEQVGDTTTWDDVANTTQENVTINNQAAAGTATLTTSVTFSRSVTDQPINTGDAALDAVFEAYLYLGASGTHATISNLPSLEPDQAWRLTVYSDVNQDVIDSQNRKGDITVTDASGTLALRMENIDGGTAAPLSIHSGTPSNGSNQELVNQLVFSGLRGRTIRIEVSNNLEGQMPLNGFILEAVTASLLTTPTITTPKARHITQRDPANLGTIALTGTYPGSPDSIEARLVVMPGPNSGQAIGWQTVDPSPSGGLYSGALDHIPAGGWYSLEVRCITAGTPGSAATLDKVGVGDIFLTVGQSNAASYGNPAATVDDDRICALINLANASPTWVRATDPMPVAVGTLGGTRGSPWTRLGPLLTDLDDVPVGFVCLAQGGSKVHLWLPADSSNFPRGGSGGNYESLLLPAIQHFKPNGFRAVLWHQGEGDTNLTPSTTAIEYKTRISEIIARSRAAAGWTIPWYLAEASYSPSKRLTIEVPIPAGQRAAVFADSDTWLGPTTNEFHIEGKTWDGIHFNAAGLLDHATQWYRILSGLTTLAVENFGFENNTTPGLTTKAPLTDGVFHLVNTSVNSSPSVLDWRILSAAGTNAADGSNGYYNPGTGQYNGAADSNHGGVLPNMVGKHVAYLSGGRAGNHFLQIQRNALIPNYTYTLTLALGVRDNGTDTFGNAMVELLANGEALITASFAATDLDALQGGGAGSATGKFTDATVTFTTGSSIAANQLSGVRITKIIGGGTYLDFDNVRLTAAPTPFGDWQILHWGATTTAAAAPDQDPERDGLENLLEFTFGNDPLKPDAIGDKMRFDGDTLTITWRREDASGLSYEIQESTTLEPGTWRPATGTTLTVISTDGDFETVEITKPGAWAGAGEPLAFVRLTVTKS